MRKNLYKPILNKIERTELLLTYGFEEESKKYKCKTIVNPVVKPKGITQTNNICKFCNKKFTTRQCKYKHRKFHCNEKNIHDKYAKIYKDKQ